MTFRRAHMFASCSLSLSLSLFSLSLSLFSPLCISLYAIPSLLEDLPRLSCALMKGPLMQSSRGVDVGHEMKHSLHPGTSSKTQREQQRDRERTEQDLLTVCAHECEHSITLTHTFLSLMCTNSHEIAEACDHQLHWIYNFF